MGTVATTVANTRDTAVRTQTRTTTKAPPAQGPTLTSNPACSNAKYAQCGGRDFAGDICCPSGMWCMATNEWWSQCEPCDETWDASCAADAAAGTTPIVRTTAEAAPPQVPAPAPSPVCTKAKYAQCGGRDYAGDICFPSGMWCMATSEWWSQCDPCDETWDASCAADAAAWTTPIVRTTAEAAPPQVPAPAPSLACTKAKYAQCGGRDYE